MMLDPVASFTHPVELAAMGQIEDNSFTHLPCHPLELHPLAHLPLEHHP